MHSLLWPLLPLLTLDDVLKVTSLTVVSCLLGHQCMDTNEPGPEFTPTVQDCLQAYNGCYIHQCSCGKSGICAGIWEVDVLGIVPSMEQGKLAMYLEI